MKTQSVWLGAIALVSFIVSSALSIPAFGGDVLTEVLREKGVISKEDWARIEADREKQAAGPQEEKKSADFPIRMEYLPGKGLLFESRDGKYSTRIHWRFQTRFSFPMDGDPITPANFNTGDTTTLQLKRARIKVAGHLNKPWIEYYLQYNWPTSTLYDFRFEFSKYKWLGLLIGLDKIPFNREWMTSSRAQMAADRSLIQRQFTSGRSVGATLLGHLFPGTAADLNYWIGIWTGTGITQATNDDNNPLYVARLQWNPLGRSVGFYFTDASFSEKPELSLAFAAMNNVSPYTRWNDNGGVGGMMTELFLCGTTACSSTNTKGFNGQFRDNQLMAELAFHYRGWAVEHEFHWKTITDNVNHTKTAMFGSFAQVSYFPHYIIPAIPKPLNLGVRYAFVKPSAGMPTGLRQEYTGAVNWFILGHNDKITLDYSYLTLDALSGAPSYNRVRLQWELQF